MKRDHRIYIIPAALIGVTMLAGGILANTNVSAETTSATAAVIVPVACTMTATVDEAHTATINNGTYQADIGATTLKTICNDSEGFSIYAIGYSNSENGNNKLLATISGTLSPSNDINTGTNTSGSPSSWAMKLAQSGAPAPTILSGYNSYSNVPTTNTKVATMIPATGGSTGASLTATYAVNISSTQPAGTYNGKVKYTMVHPASETPLEPKDATPKCISYWPNASGVTDSMGDQCSFGNNASANLWASNFQRAGYGFAGWSTTYDYSDPTGFYGPNETITTPNDMTDKGLSLYAIWVKSAGNLQNWNYCAALDPGQVTALTDQRDNQTYAVAKLADGNCWMIENLRLDNDATGNSDGSLAQGYAQSTTYGNFSGLADPETANFSGSSTTANSLYYSGTQSGTATINISTINDPAYRFPRYNNQNTSSPATNMTAWNNNANTYSVGNWYTWPAAVADTSYYSTNNQTITSTSICPSGWRLPKGGNKTRIESDDDNEFWNLAVDGLNNGTLPANYSSSAYPYYTGTEATGLSNALRSYPNNFIYSGDFGGSSPGGRGSGGYYWSSTVDSYGSSFDLYLSSSGVDPGTGSSNKYGGFSIRCVSGS